MKEIDDHFFDRADEHIHLSNKQLGNSTKGRVSASMMYSVARFNSWLSACGFNTAEEMQKEKKELIKYFVTEYEKMLNENLDDYIDNFEEYMSPE